MAGEFALIDKYFARATPSAILGPGDDCALLQPTPGKQLAITTDMLVAGTHFLPDTDPRKLGWKALAVNLSDLAAMGATPRCSPAACRRSTRNGLAISATASSPAPTSMGWTSSAATPRAGRSMSASPRSANANPARPCAATARDLIWVSGRPGLASLGLAQLQGRIELTEPWRRLCVATLEKPRPRVALGLALVGIASAAIDVSDGLLADLGHIGERSGLAAAVQLVQLPHLPKGDRYDADLRRLAIECQLAGGDDYELCFTTPPGQTNAVSAIAARFELPLWCIGRMVEGTAGEVTVFDPDGNPIDFPQRGYDHFG